MHFYTDCYILNEHTKRILIPSIDNCTRFYALTKIEKPNLAFPPTVFNIDTVSYKIAGFLSQCLFHVTSKKFYSVRSFFEFMDKL